MKLKGPITLNACRLFYGCADLYYWKGIPVARSWPRYFTQPETPKQVKTWTDLKAYHAIRKAAPAGWINFFKRIPGAVGRTAEDWRRKYVLWILAKNLPITTPAIAWTYRVNSTPDNTITVYMIHDDLPAGQDGNNIRWRYKLAEGNKNPTELVRYGWKASREHYKLPRMKIQLNGWSTPIAQTYSAAINQWKIVVPLTSGKIWIIGQPKTS